MPEWMISIVIPVFNEEAIIRHTYARLKTVMHPWRHELIFVDDGSNDHSGEYLAALSAQDPAVKVVMLSQNFDHHLAVSFGAHDAQVKLVASKDAKQSTISFGSSYTLSLERASNLKLSKFRL